MRVHDRILCRCDRRCPLLAPGRFLPELPGRTGYRIKPLSSIRGLIIPAMPANCGSHPSLPASTDTLTGDCIGAPRPHRQGPQCTGYPGKSAHHRFASWNRRPRRSKRPVLRPPTPNVPPALASHRTQRRRHPEPPVVGGGVKRSQELESVNEQDQVAEPDRRKRQISPGQASCHMTTFDQKRRFQHTVAGL